MGADEVATLDALTARREILDGLIANYGGRIANTAGDSVLAEFGSAVDAVRCATEAQGALAEANSTLPETRHINFRIGVHVGDVMVRAGDLFGDGVNIAARLQTVARAGGLCISGVTYDQVRKILPLDFTDLGFQKVKNIEEPIRAYEVSERGRDTALVSREGAAPRLSIVVLPFANIGGDPEQEYFVDGVTESLTTDLSRITGAFVIARNTAFTFKGKAIDVKKLGRELNVRYVLEGSVQRSGNRLRVNVQLVDAENANHLWARMLATDCAYHRPPRAVGIPRAFSTAAICRSVLAPAFWASRMMGSMFAAYLSASVELWVTCILKFAASVATRTRPLRSMSYAGRR